MRNSVTVIFTAPNDQDIVDAYISLVDHCITIANNHPVNVEVSELDPAKYEADNG